MKYNRNETAKTVYGSYSVIAFLFQHFISNVRRLKQNAILFQFHFNLITIVRAPLSATEARFIGATCIPSLTGCVKGTAEKFKADDGKHQNSEEHQQTDL